MHKLLDSSRWAPWEADVEILMLTSSVLERLGTHDPDALAEFDTHVEAIVEAVRRHGTDGVMRYLAAAPAGCLDRWAVVRTLEMYPGWTTPERPCPPKRPKGRRAGRPLTPLEHGLVRVCALRNPTVWALVAVFEAGATSSELAGLTAESFTLSDGAWHVFCPGHSEVAPREIRLRAWANPGIAKRLQELGESEPMFRWSTPAAPRRSNDATSSVLMRVNELLKTAGLTVDFDVVPSSIRLSDTYRREMARQCVC